MKFKFSLTKNVHMYNHLLICEYKNERFEIMCESAPVREETILFWPDKVNLSPEEYNKMIVALIEWANGQDFNYKIYSNNKWITNDA